MRKIIMMLLIGLIFSPVFSQTDNKILEIRAKFKLWQPIIDKKINNCEKFFNYAWGNNYQFNEWFNKEIESDTLTLSEFFSIISDDKLGIYVHNDLNSFSGDWHITADYYYNLNEKLYFIFWRMNTFYAEEPLTVEKRIYFDANGDKISELRSVFKMNTKENIEIDFLDRDVSYKINLKDEEFYKYWKAIK